MCDLLGYCCMLQTAVRSTQVTTKTLTSTYDRRAEWTETGEIVLQKYFGEALKGGAIYMSTVRKALEETNLKEELLKTGRTLGEKQILDKLRYLRRLQRN